MIAIVDAAGTRPTEPRGPQRGPVVKRDLIVPVQPRLTAHNKETSPVLDPTGCGVSSVYRSRRVVKNGACVIALDSHPSGTPTRNSTTAMIFTGVAVPGTDLTIT
jgi:hypothetical protein